MDKRDTKWQAEAKSRYERECGKWKKWFLRLGGEIFVRTENLVPDNPDNPSERLYLFYCAKTDARGKPHGPQIDYRHGYERTVRCRTCESALAASLAPQPELVHLQV